VAADWGSVPNKADALPSTNQGNRLSNLALSVTDNDDEYSLQTVSSTTETISAASLDDDFRFPRNNARVLSAVFPPPGVGGTVTEPELPRGESLAQAEQEDGGLIPMVALATAVILSATGLGAFELRRRSRRG
jgi:hypothetical protein